MERMRGRGEEMGVNLSESLGGVLIEGRKAERGRTVGGREKGEKKEGGREEDRERGREGGGEVGREGGKQEGGRDLDEIFSLPLCVQFSPSLPVFKAPLKSQRSLTGGREGGRE